MSNLNSSTAHHPLHSRCWGREDPKNGTRPFPRLEDVMRAQAIARSPGPTPVVSADPKDGTSGRSSRRQIASRPRNPVKRERNRSAHRCPSATRCRQSRRPSADSIALVSPVSQRQQNLVHCHCGRPGPCVRFMYPPCTTEPSHVVAETLSPRPAQPGKLHTGCYKCCVAHTSSRTMGLVACGQ